MKTILIVRSEDFSSEYGAMLFNRLIQYKELIVDNAIHLLTNIRFQGEDIILKAFSKYMMGLKSEGVSKIIINL